MPVEIVVKCLLICKCLKAFHLSFHLLSFFIEVLGLNYLISVHVCVNKWEGCALLAHYCSSFCADNFGVGETFVLGGLVVIAAQPLFLF